MNKLRYLRKSKGLTLREVAKDMNMSFSNLGALERSEHQLREETAKRFSLYYNVSVDYLLGIKEEKNELLVGDILKKNTRIFFFITNRIIRNIRDRK